MWQYDFGFSPLESHLSHFLSIIQKRIRTDDVQTVPLDHLTILDCRISRLVVNINRAVWRLQPSHRKQTLHHSIPHPFIAMYVLQSKICVISAVNLRHFPLVVSWLHFPWTNKNLKPKPRFLPAGVFVHGEQSMVKFLSLPLLKHKNTLHRKHRCRTWATGRLLCQYAKLDLSGSVKPGLCTPRQGLSWVWGCGCVCEKTTVPFLSAWGSSCVLTFDLAN